LVLLRIDPRKKLIVKRQVRRNKKRQITKLRRNRLKERKPLEKEEMSSIIPLPVQNYVIEREKCISLIANIRVYSEEYEVYIMTQPKLAEINNIRYKLVILFNEARHAYLKNEKIYREYLKYTKLEEELYILMDD
jgi:hypothetical protein